MNAKPLARGGINKIRVQHTPGPWAAHETDTRTAIKSADRTVAYVQMAPGEYFNAALIEAAPALLELAMQYATECMECAGVGVTLDNEDCADCRDVREIIAQATGEDL